MVSYETTENSKIISGSHDVWFASSHSYPLHDLGSKLISIVMGVCVCRIECWGRQMAEPTLAEAQPPLPAAAKAKAPPPEPCRQPDEEDERFRARLRRSKPRHP